MTNYQSILVAIDGSKEAEVALEKAIGIVKRNQGSTLNIVNIVDARIEAYSPAVYDGVQKESNELLAKYKAEAEEAGIEHVNTILEFGSPRVKITQDIADAVKADLIICGATGLNAVERFLIGSVSESIIRSAECDVLVVRAKS